ncbi:hypothetical protein [Saccharopolyspora sp. NPDC002686]|uniref:hypothetical protein n=1 Tax=Saccharopolyspora sp. NPDC002686 TaxID=3154541 RepID=UPI00331925CC
MVDHLVIAAASDVKWTEIVSSSSAVGSALIAATAATFAYRAYRKQAAQLELAQKHDLRWQASKVTGWLADITHGYAGDVQAGNLDATIKLAFWFVNASDLPVYDVHVYGEGIDGEVRRIAKFGYLLPTEEPITNPLDRDAFRESFKRAKELYESLPPEAKDFDRFKYQRDKLRFAMSPHRNQQGKQPDFSVEALNMVEAANRLILQQIAAESRRLKENFRIEFRDCEGRRWCRSANGELTTLE